MYWRLLLKTRKSKKSVKTLLLPSENMEKELQNYYINV